MKFLEEIPSSRNPDVMIPVFKCGKEEVQLIRDLLSDFQQKTPKVFSISPTRNRVKSMLREIDGYLIESNKEL